jgi:hypothetical protein
MHNSLADRKSTKPRSGATNACMASALLALAIFCCYATMDATVA